MEPVSINAPVLRASGRSRTCTEEPSEQSVQAALRAVEATKRDSARSPEAVAAGGGLAADPLDKKENKSTPMVE
ncbi:hypothetical protein G1C95_0613 [Bifidobacterium sp. DSM 109957]|uniref:Uncharacterized protein n=1 Tax=Bifidobacterium oedipodis TaxID=2675322 RepID=A0A7Y0EN98_9BIFI|nr:hypothetical protein [Bifidobacterium sp. DSM 109957]